MATTTISYGNDQECAVCRQKARSGTLIEDKHRNQFFLCWPCDGTGRGKAFKASVYREVFDAEIDKLRTEGNCRFVLQSGKYCGFAGWPYCATHKGKTCTKCEAQATHIAARFGEGAGECRCDQHGQAAQMYTSYGTGAYW